MPYPVAAARGRSVQAGGNPYPDILVNLTSWWPMDETSGTRADSHGTNDLTPGGSLSYAAGKVGNAADIEESTTDYLTAANHSSLQIGASDFTIWGWFYKEGGESAYATLFNKKFEFYIGTQLASDGKPYFQVGDGAAFLTAVQYGGAALSNATWYFLVAWHDVSEKLVYLQLNNGTVYSQVYIGVAAVTTNALYLGAQIDGGTQEFDGLMDEWALAKGYILSADERTWLYNSGAGRAYGAL